MIWGHNLCRVRFFCLTSLESRLDALSNISVKQYTSRFSLTMLCFPVMKGILCHRQIWCTCFYRFHFVSLMSLSVHQVFHRITDKVQFPVHAIYVEKQPWGADFSVAVDCSCRVPCWCNTSPVVLASFSSVLTSDLRFLVWNISSMCAN